MKKKLWAGLAIGLTLTVVSSTALAVPVTISDVPGYGYNSGSSPFVGCGPTSGAMILDTYDNRLSGTDGLPGDLVSDPLATAWDLHNNYMGTNDAGFGAPSDFHYGIEQYAADQGYLLDAVLHVESTGYATHATDPSWWWNEYAYGDDLLDDADFWNTSTWDIIVDDFLSFIAVEIDAGRPFMATVDSDGANGTDHWMVGTGYDFDTGQWAGYNTYDNSLHWYDVTSAFIPGNPMGIGFIRTFEFGGLINQGEPGDPVPEPATMLLFGTGLVGLVGSRLRKKKK